MNINSILKSIDPFNFHDMFKYLFSFYHGESSFLVYFIVSLLFQWF